MSTNRINIIALFIVLAITMVGCKSKKEVVKSGDGVLYTKSHNEVLDDVLKNKLAYTTLSTKGSIELISGSSSKKLTAYYKIIKDEVMQASIRVPLLGEVARLDITPDSIFVVDRMKGRYVAESISIVNSKVNLDFNYYNLQALLTNQLFVPGQADVVTKDYTRFVVSTTPDTYILQTKGEPNLSYNFAVDGLDKILSVFVLSKDDNSALRWTYSDFIKEDGQTYPTNMLITASVNEKSYGIGIGYSTLEIDKKDMTISTTIPKKYDKVSFSELFDSFK